MKVCTACNASYLDENLSFCPVDGAALKQLKEVSFDQIPFPYEPGSWSDTDAATPGEVDSAKNFEPPPKAAYINQPPPVPQNIPNVPKRNTNHDSFFTAVAGSIGLAVFVGALLFLLSGSPNESVPQVREIPDSRITLANGTTIRAEPMDSSRMDSSKPTSAVSANTAVVVNPASSPARIAAGKPISKKVDFTGVWQGKFNEEPTVLSITTQKSDTFSGTLSKKGYIVKISGKIDFDKATVVITETDVLQNPPNLKWNLGINDGTISEGGKTMGGTGKDKNGSYPWAFTKE